MGWKMPTSKERNEKTNVMLVTPVRVGYVKTVWKDKHIVLVFPHRYSRVLRLLPFRLSPLVVHVELEEHGTAVWQLIDGKRTVAEIVQELGFHFNYEEGYESRVVTYLLQLQKDGLIRLLLPL